MRRAALAALVVLALGGCAIPAWVPFVGKKAPDKGTAGSTASRRLSKPTAVDAPGPSTAQHPTAPIDDSVTDRVVAVVNNDAITLAELQESIVLYRQERRVERSVPDAELARQFLARLIETRLQLQEAEREKINVEESEVDDEIRARMKRFGATTMKEFEDMVKSQGISMDNVRKRMRETLRVAKVVRRKVALRVSVTDEEIDQYVAENRAKLETGLSYHAHHILVTPVGESDAAWESARIRADLIRTQILEGADFGELARQHSKDASAKSGGDLGTLKRGELAPEIEAQILALQPGELSTPYRSPLGYHLFRLDSKEVLEGDGLHRVRQQVREILFRQKYEVRFKAWVKEMRQRAVIEIRM